MGRTRKTCFICKSSEDDELLFGKFFSKGRLQVHYYCLLLTSNLVQNGDTDDDGILGFLPEDIISEEANNKNRKCYICKQPYANIWCCAKKCFRTFHTVCGRRGRCLSYFTGTFQSWCDRHVELEDNERHAESDPCAICYEELGSYDRLESIRAPCCQNGWFHRQCVAQFAQTAGYFFKCPLCNNKDEFGQAVQMRGVYIPEKDAAWELEPNAFSDQLERPSECDAEPCRCPAGRDHDSSEWDLRFCETCGSTCRHDTCMDVPTKNYVCTFCRPIIGDEPPPAVLALAEESRRAEEARERQTAVAADSSSDSSSSEDDEGDSDSSEVVGRKRKTTRRIRSTDSDSTVSSIGIARNRSRKGKRTIVDSSDCSDSASEIEVTRSKSKKQRRLSSTPSSTSSGRSSSLKWKQASPLSEAARRKLLHDRAVVRLDKLSPELIEQLTALPAVPERATPRGNDTPSSESDGKFDFNYRAKMTKQHRRKSVSELQTLRDVIRSDTDTLTDGSGGLVATAAAAETNKTPSRHKGNFAKQFKLRLFGAKSAASSRKRPASTSESDPEHHSSMKKARSTAPPSPSKSRVSLFPPENTENTCPNSPRKQGDGEGGAAVEPPNTPLTRYKPATSTGSDHKLSHQTRLSSFFKKSPKDEATLPHGSSSSGSSGDRSVPSSAGHKSSKKRKKLMEMEHGQRNLLDYFNRS